MTYEAPAVSQAQRDTTAGPRGDGTPVAMMVWNTCENDSRVIKEATSLASAGYQVTVVCLAADHLPDLETKAGVTYQRVGRVFGPIRDRVDMILSSVGVLVVAVFGAAVIAGLGMGVWQLAGWGAGAERAPLAAAIVGVFVLGGLVGTRFKPRRMMARARTLVRNITKKIPIRNRLLLAIYRVLTFRLVYLTMGDAVTALAPAVIHAHDLQTLPAGARLAKTLNASLVYDSHELATHVSTRPPLFFRLWMGWKERRSIPVADRVLTVSGGIAEHLERKYRIRRPDLVFNSPPTVTTSSGTTVRDDLGLGAEVPLALYVGALTANRGLEQTVDTLGLLPEFHLACVGPRQDEWESDMRARARKSASEDRLHFLDPVPIERLIDYLSTADVGVIAIQNITLSYWFTMPNKLFETVLAGVPVVVADLPHLRDFVETNNVGVVADQTDPAAIASAVRQVAARPDFRPGAGHLARLREQYGWEAQARRLVEIYAGLAGSRRELD